jgi:hypothetical protein
MESYKITLEFCGMEKEGTHVRLDDFIAELGRFSGIARNAEDVISGNAERSIYYRITDLTHNSPARVTIEACVKENQPDRREATLKEISSTMNKLKKGEQIKGENRFYLVDSMRYFAEPVGIKLSRLNVIFGNDKINLDEEFKARAALYVAPEESCTSTARGMLDAINIHGVDRIFWLYPEIGASKVQCLFPEKLFEMAKTALGKRVEVAGVFKYKVNAPYPHLAEVEEMMVFPSNDELPTFKDLFGIDPEMTNGLSCDDYIRKVRSAN